MIVIVVILDLHQFVIPGWAGIQANVHLPLDPCLREDDKVEYYSSKLGNCAGYVPVVAICKNFGVVVILTDEQILKAISHGLIRIDPFRREALGSNSYDVHLGETLAVYENEELDAKIHNPIRKFAIPSEGFVLEKEKLYLGVTKEYTETLAHVPFLEGKSSVGRLGIDIHATAGKGDIGFKNHWTLEISVKQNVRVYAGMPIGQLIYFSVNGNVLTAYDEKASAKYNGRTNFPVESMMWKNFPLSS